MSLLTIVYLIFILYMLVHSGSSSLSELKWLCSQLYDGFLILQQYQRARYHLITSYWPCFLFYFYIHYSSHPHSTHQSEAPFCISLCALMCCSPCYYRFESALHRNIRLTVLPSFRSHMSLTHESANGLLL